MLPKKGHFTFESEIGFQYFSAPTVVNNLHRHRLPELHHTPMPTATAAPSPAKIISEQNKLQNDLYDLRFFPILSFGLSYKIH